MLTENVIEVEKNIQAACDRAGRSREEVRLIAVSKTKPVSDIEEVLTTGILDYGENKVQELSDKYDVLPKNIRWHMIGHLQRNKVKYLIGKTVLIHSVDSLRLAEQIEHEAAKADTIMNVLIEVNVAGEESKFGTTCNEAIELVRAVAALKHVKIKGLMTIAPFTDNPEDNRIYFKKLKQLSVDIKSKNIDNVDMDELSMGMTGDYEVAIEEGATMVRVGTGIFGERNYQI
ncbi:MAG: YggS family pyridoxal phosphate-dependent enzyme [Coprococcus sp.]|nr:YggS family pyridoxal phosphate-dependent enzyme [Coprococcus sp.]